MEMLVMSCVQTMMLLMWSFEFRMRLAEEGSILGQSLARVE